MADDDKDVEKAMKQLEDRGKIPDFVKELDDLADKLSAPGPKEEAVFEELRIMCVGVWLVEYGKLVKVSDRGSEKPAAHREK